ncbi:uncharacterized protein TNCV_3527091 [Trichonephila clavipes]|nr:uncharacterized protein TNCV_3527091 [Trichonephila clavipes]
MCPPNLNALAASISHVLFIKLSDTGIGSEDQPQSLEIELTIPFVPNRDPPDTLNNPSSVRSCIIIHQNEVVTNSSSIWADIWIKDLIPISKTSYGSSMEHMQVSVATERDPCPNQDSTTSITGLSTVLD